MNQLIIFSYIPDFLFWSLCTVIRNKQKKDIDFLRKKYICNLNGWAFGHFISYYTKGLYFQERYCLDFFFIGFFFEIVEYFIEHHTNVEFVDSSIIIDPIINSLGYMSGVITIYIIKTN